MFTFQEYHTLLSERLAFIPTGKGGHIHYQYLNSNAILPEPKYTTSGFRWVGEKVNRLILTSKCDSSWNGIDSRVYIGHDLIDEKDDVYHASIKGTANIQRDRKLTHDDFSGEDVVPSPVGSFFPRGNVPYKEKSFTAMDIDNYNELIQNSVSEFKTVNGVRQYDIIIYPESRSNHAQDIAIELQKQLGGQQKVLRANKLNITLAALTTIIDVPRFTRDCMNSVEIPSDINLASFEVSVKNAFDNWVKQSSQNNQYFSVGTHFKVRTGGLVGAIIRDYNMHNNKHITLKRKLFTSFLISDYLNGSLFDLPHLSASVQELRVNNRVLFVDDNVTEGSMFTTLFNHLPTELKGVFDFFFLIVKKQTSDRWRKTKK